MFLNFLLMMIIPAIAVGSLFRHESSLSLAPVKTMAVVGTYPASPVYAVATTYDTTCTTSNGIAVKLLNTCLGLSGGGSQMYTCAGSAVSLVSYSDNACQTQTGSSVWSSTTCLTDSVYFGGSVVSTYGLKTSTCTANDNTAISVNVVTANFNDNACNNLLEGWGFYNNVCYPVTASGVAASVKFAYPYANLYVGSTCSGTANTNSLTTTCTASGSSSSDGAANNVYFAWAQLSSAAPQNMHLGVGALIAALMIFFQLKN